MRLFLFSVLVGCTFACSGGDRSPSWTLTFPKHEAWKEAFVQRHEAEYTIEYTQNNESVEAWSQLVTFTYRKAAKENFPNMMNYLLIQLQKDCPSFQQKLIDKQDTKLIFQWSHDGCGGFPAQEVVGRFEYVDEGLLNVQYARLKGKGTTDLDKWVRAIVAARVAH